MAQFVILPSQAGFQTEDRNGFHNLKKTHISTQKVETILMLPVFYRQHIIMDLLHPDSEPLWLAWTTMMHDMSPEKMQYFKMLARLQGNMNCFILCDL